MLKKTITYTDYNGESRTEDFYFNLNKAELLEMELTNGKGSYAEFIKDAIARGDSKSLFEIFKDFIVKGYGKKSPDGRIFEKKKEYTDEFLSTDAYSELVMELASDVDVAADFFNSIIPNGLSEMISSDSNK